MGTRICRNKGSTLTLPLFFHALGPQETLAFLLVEGDLNALDSRLIFRNQQCLKRIDTTLCLFELGGHPPDRTADLRPRAEYTAGFDPPGPKLVENRADTGGAVRE